MRFTLLSFVFWLLALLSIAQTNSNIVNKNIKQITKSFEKIVILKQAIENGELSPKKRQTKIRKSFENIKEFEILQIKDSSIYRETYKFISIIYHLYYVHYLMLNENNIPIDKVRANFIKAKKHYFSLKKYRPDNIYYMNYYKKHGIDSSTFEYLAKELCNKFNICDSLKRNKDYSQFDVRKDSIENPFMKFSIHPQCDTLVVEYDSIISYFKNYKDYFLYTEKPINFIVNINPNTTYGDLLNTFQVFDNHQRKVIFTSFKIYNERFLVKSKKFKKFKNRQNQMHEDKLNKLEMYCDSLDRAFKNIQIQNEDKKHFKNRISFYEERLISCQKEIAIYKNKTINSPNYRQKIERKYLVSVLENETIGVNRLKIYNPYAMHISLIKLKPARSKIIQINNENLQIIGGELK